MKLLRQLMGAIDRAIDFQASVAMILCYAMMFAVTYDVIMRQFFRRPTMWAIASIEWGLLFITFLGSAWVLREDKHVKVELVLNRLNPRAQTLLRIIVPFIGAIICSAVVWLGTEVSWDLFQRGVTTSREIDIPSVIIVAIIPVGSFFLAVQFLRMAFRRLATWRSSGRSGETWSGG